MTRWLAAIAGVLATVVVATGVYTTFRYRPDATGFLLGVQRMHAVAGIVLAVVVVIGLAARIWERRPDRRYGLPAFGLVVVIGVLLAVQVAIGRRIAWDQLALWAVDTTTAGRTRGVLLRDLPLKFVVSDGQVVGVTDFRRQVWLHLLVLPVLVAGASGFVIWWTQRFGSRFGSRSGSGRVG